MRSIFKKVNNVIESAQSYRAWRHLVLSLASGKFPRHLTVAGDLSLSHLRMRTLPGMTVGGSLDLRMCQRLSRLGEKLSVQRDLLIGGRYSGQPQYQQNLLNDLDAPAFIRQMSRDGYAPLITLPEQVRVKGDLILRCCHRIAQLPEKLYIGGSLYLNRCDRLTHIPNSLRSLVGLYIYGCKQLKELPEGLTVKWLVLVGSRIERLPDSLNVTNGIHVVNCRKLKSVSNFGGFGMGRLEYISIKKSAVERLPERITAKNKILMSGLVQTEINSSIKAGSIIIEKCRKLERITGVLDAGAYISLKGNRKLKTFPLPPRSLFTLELENCESLHVIPPGLQFELSEYATLDLTNCKKIEYLPEKLKFNGYLEIFGSGLKDIPEGLQNCHLRWQGHWVHPDLIFHPERLTPDRILTQRNAEIRRLMLEKVGIDHVLAQADADEIHQDRDAGGKRSLMHVNLQIRGRKILSAFFRCVCPSTGREYLLAVPDHLEDCQSAAAWIAGFDNASEYKPLRET